MTATRLTVLAAGPACTLQDGGRTGWLRFGVTPAGPMDWVAHATANVLADNPPGTVAIEAGPGGLTVAATDAPLRLGLVASGFTSRKGDRPLPDRCALTLLPGEVLTLTPGQSHLWAYLALSGGIALPPVMGSHATHLRAAIGPMGALAPGDRLPVTARPAGPDMALPAAHALPRTIRYLPGPQSDAFPPETHHAFHTASWTIAPRSDRMAYRLSGPSLTHANGHDIVSDGIPLGAIQIPGDGQPFVLMADRQPTGGYPKIGTVIRADLPALAQTRPGETLRFQPVTHDQATAALRRAAPPADLARHLRPVTTGPDLAALATGNHASGFIDARNPDAPLPFHLGPNVPRGPRGG